MPNWPEQDQRRSRRIQVQGEVDAAATLLFRGSVVNLSGEGVCIEHLEKVELGQVCDLKFRIPPMTFTVRARIVWSRPHGEGSGAPGAPRLFRSGAEFADISEDTRAAIAAVMHRPPA